MKPKILRELGLICVPLILLIGAGAWISRAQKERNAKEHERNSGPLHSRIDTIAIMSTDAQIQRLGYNHSVLFTAKVEGRKTTPLALGDAWMIQAKSVQIINGKTVTSARFKNIVSPFVIDTTKNAFVEDVLIVDEICGSPDFMMFNVYCRSSLAHPNLKMQLEAVAGKPSPMPKGIAGALTQRALVASGPRLQSTFELIPLRPWSDSDPYANMVKNEP